MGASVITVPAFASMREGVQHFFGTRGHAETVALDVGVPAQAGGSRGRGWLLSVKQVHGTDALVLDRPLTEGDRFDGGWDALVTDQPGVTVAVRTADCVPVLVYDRHRRAVAAIHAGWRGAVAGIVPRTIDLLISRFKSAEGDLRVSIGPSAGACCYEVDETVLSPLRSGWSDWHAVVRENRGTKARLDLKELVRRQLANIGIRPEHVTTVNLCTICHGDLFYSYRREGRVNGTMLSGITLAAHR
jgi:purine-nucleoside/S-methyl-5'-thioadenosine phosphorylase / adenosine deaminase